MEPVQARSHVAEDDPTRTSPRKSRLRAAKGADRTIRLPLVAQMDLLVHHGKRRRNLQIVDGSGQSLLLLSVTRDGVVLKLGNLAVQVGADGALTLEAERVTFVGRKGVALRSEGDIDVSAAGKLTLEAREQILTARLGNVEVKANDDVALNGERILLNS